MSQDRLRNVLVAAAEAAVSHPDWQDSDRLCFILEDEADTVLTTRGRYGALYPLAELLEFHADKLRQAEKIS